MRKLGPPSEIHSLAAPIASLLDGAWQRMQWWVVAMAVLYVLSGITIVGPGQVAGILRWGRLVGDSPASQQHGLGMLLAFPQPVDRVVRIQVKPVCEVSVTTLATGSMFGKFTLDPVTDGYAATGDHNIVHAAMMARYRIREPAEWAFYGPKAGDAPRVEDTAAMTRSIDEVNVDRILSDGKPIPANAPPTVNVSSYEDDQQP